MENRRAWFRRSARRPESPGKLIAPKRTYAETTFSRRNQETFLVTFMDRQRSEAGVALERYVVKHCSIIQQLHYQFDVLGTMAQDALGTTSRKHAAWRSLAAASSGFRLLLMCLGAIRKLKEATGRSSRQVKAR